MEWKAFIYAVSDSLEAGIAGSRFPLLTDEIRYDGSWSVAECAQLEKDLQTIQAEFSRLQSTSPPEHAGENSAPSLYTQFRDVDGSLLLDRLIHLCRIARSTGKPILYQ